MPLAAKSSAKRLRTWNASNASPPKKNLRRK
jgi:hypothetical protein